MIGQIFSVFLNSYAESARLKKRFRLITTRLGWITVAASVLALMPAMYYSFLLFGLPIEGGSIEGLRLQLIAWVVFIIMIIPAAFYLGMVLVYGAFALMMFVAGRFTREQAADFALRSKYPQTWYRGKYSPAQNLSSAGNSDDA